MNFRRNVSAAQLAEAAGHRNSTARSPAAEARPHPGTVLPCVAFQCEKQRKLRGKGKQPSEGPGQVFPLDPAPEGLDAPAPPCPGGEGNGSAQQQLPEEGGPVCARAALTARRTQPATPAPVGSELAGRQPGTSVMLRSSLGRGGRAWGEGARGQDGWPPCLPTLRQPGRPGDTAACQAPRLYPRLTVKE